MQAKSYKKQPRRSLPSRFQIVLNSLSYVTLHALGYYHRQGQEDQGHPELVRRDVV